MKPIKIKFGSFGTQYAVLLKPGRKRGNYRVRKWRAKSKSWTGPVTIHKDQIIDRNPDIDEFRKAVGW